MAAEDEDGDGNCSLQELLAAHLANAEQALEMQHQRTLRAVARHLEATAQLLPPYASSENEILRAQLAEPSDSAHVVAEDSVSKVLREAARPSIELMRVDSGDPVRPDSRERRTVPDPPRTAPRRLPGSLIEMNEEEENDNMGMAFTKSFNARVVQCRFSEKEEKDDDIADTATNKPLKARVTRFSKEEEDNEDAGAAFSKPFKVMKTRFIEEEEEDDDDDDAIVSTPVQARITRKADGILKRQNALEKKSTFKHGFKLLEVWNEQKKQGGIEHSMYSTSFRPWGSILTSSLENQDVDTYMDNGCASKCIIHPYNAKKSFWDIISLILVLYDMIMIPMGFFDLPEDSKFLIAMAWTTRIFWTLDMPLSFLSGFVTVDGTIELRLRPIVIRYLKSWFFLDLLVVGVDWFEIIMSAAAESLGFARLGKASRVFRILRMIRLLRLARMTQVIALLTERLNSERLVIAVDILKLLIFMTASGHLLACLWYAVGEASHDDKGLDSWLTEYEFKDKGLDMRYVMSLRWAISQFAGGMDEVTPKSLGENVYAIFVYLTAFWSGAVFLSILTSSMTQWYIMGSQQSQQLTILRRYLAQNGISKKLALRVQRNAQHAASEQQRVMPEGAVMLMSKVSEPLKIELHFEMYSHNLLVHPFFNRYVEECPHVMRKVCHSAMSTSTVSVGDTIFHGGEIPCSPKMYIVSRGHLFYTSSVTALTSNVLAGDWVSEQTLWVQWVHRGTLAANEDCLLFYLTAGEFQAIVGRFEHSGFDPRVYASTYVDCLNDCECDVNDLQLHGLDAKLERVTQRSKSRVNASFFTRSTRRGGRSRGMRSTFFPSLGSGKHKTVSVFSRSASSATVDTVSDRASSNTSRPSAPWAGADSMASGEPLHADSTTAGGIGEIHDSKGTTSVGAVLAYAKSDYNDNDSEDSIVIPNAKEAEAIGMESQESFSSILKRTSRQYQNGGKRYSNGEFRRPSATGQAWNPSQKPQSPPKQKRGVAFAVTDSGSPPDISRRYRLKKPPVLQPLRSPDLSSEDRDEEKTTWCEEEEV